MSKNTLRVLTVAALVTVAAAIGLTVVAADGAPAERVAHWMGKLHGHGGHCGHGGPGGHAFQAVHGLIDDLDLSADQQARLEALHSTLMSGFDAVHQEGGAHLEALIERIETGSLDRGEASLVMEQHIAALGEMLESATGEVVDLVNSLDADQRALLVAHLKAVTDR